MSETCIRLVVVTNIPVPYREPIYEKLANEQGIDLTVIYCSAREPDREWNLPEQRYKQVILNERFLSVGERFIHFNTDIWSALEKLSPDVVVTTGYNPTHLMAFLYAKRYGLKHIEMTDGTLDSERSLSLIHRIVRRLVFSGSSSFIGACEGSFDLFRHYGIDESAMFKSHLCANNKAFMTPTESPAPYADLIFSGRLVERKNPIFALKVAGLVSQRLGRRITLAVLGNGPLKDQLIREAEMLKDKVELDFRGFVQQEDLPRHFQSARIFLFPSSWDPWGVVANEACASGVPVIVSHHAGVADELIVDGENGFVRPLDLNLWADAVVSLLGDNDLHQRFAMKSREKVLDYSYENAALGMAAAVRYSTGVTAHEEYSCAIRPQPAKACVLIVQRRMTHYRIPLFEMLRDRLSQHGVRLKVVSGNPTVSEALRKDAGVLPWADYQECHYFLRGYICWQNLKKHLWGASLVIVTQENKLIYNYKLISARKKLPMAYWGHGRNFQTKVKDSFRERMKRWLTVHADWWFAYTEASADVVRKCGFPEKKITVLNNAVDTQGMRSMRDALDQEALDAYRIKLGLPSTSIGIFVGSLDPVKNIGMLIESAKLIKQTVPDFVLLIVGDGSLSGFVQEQAELSGGWIRWLGVQKGEAKVKLISIARLILNPGMVGLGILDSFACGVPMVTTADPRHSPEISYLQNGVNGLITDINPSSFAEAAIKIIQDEAFYQTLSKGCFVSSEQYTLEKMVENFSEGIMQCLAEVQPS